VPLPAVSRVVALRAGVGDENQICQALRTLDPQARVAHLAYTNTITPPQKIKPDSGIFLEFAPIYRRYDVAYEEQQDPSLKDGLRALDANLTVFPPLRLRSWNTGWTCLVSRTGRSRRKASLEQDVFLADVETYARRGIRHVTSFAAWIDHDYQERYGDLSFIDQYGEGLQRGEQ